KELVEQTAVRRALAAKLPSCVSSSIRTDGESDYIFIMNFSNEPRQVALDGARYSDLVSGEAVGAELELAPYGVKVITRKVNG
ncbi:Beta-galactosidase C-terminal domain, partial [Paenibacillus glucanolyticus]